MRPFLRGFADELTKIAGGDPWSAIPRPPSTVTGNEQAAQPQNALRPSNQALGAIPKQRMEWSPSAKKDTWEPSPGYKIEKPKTEPPKPKPGGVSKPKPGNTEPSFESVQGKAQRLSAERAFNAGQSAAKTDNPLKNAPPTTPEANKQMAQEEKTHGPYLPQPRTKEREAFFAAQPNGPKNTTLRTPGALRAGKDLPKNYGKVESPKKPDALDELEALHPGAAKIDMPASPPEKPAQTTARVEAPPPAPKRHRPVGHR